MQRRYNPTYFILASVVALSLILLTMGIDANAQIAFASNRDGDFEIYVMDADGNNPRRLTKNFGNAWDPPRGLPTANVLPSYLMGMGTMIST